jgi:hypothetical protein
VSGLIFIIAYIMLPIYRWYFRISVRSLSLNGRIKASDQNYDINKKADRSLAWEKRIFGRKRRQQSWTAGDMSSHEQLTYFLPLFNKLTSCCGGKRGIERTTDRGRNRVSFYKKQNELNSILIIIIEEI